MIFAEVGVSSLRAVELQGFVVGARGGCVTRGVGDLGGFTISPGVH